MIPQFSNKDQFAIGKAEFGTGHILKNNNRLFLKDDNPNEAFEFFDSFEAARQVVIDKVTKNPDIECWIIDSNGKCLYHYDRNGERKESILKTVKTLGLTTVEELDKWMTDNCYNNNYAIGSRNIDEGFGLDKAGNQFIWYYTERGKREHLNYFPTEKEAVDFAFSQISTDDFAQRHMIGFIKDNSEKLELLQELDRRKIKYWTDTIPYGGLNDPRHRVFIFGCDIKLTEDLKEKYCSNK
jgi:hypothetical protein